MPTEGQVLMKTRDEIVQALMDGLVARVPDAYVGEDGNLFLLFSVIGDVDESVFLAIQIVADDMFASTASPQALDIHGQERRVPRLAGSKSSGNLRFSGTGGTDIPANTEVGYDPGAGNDLLYFNTTADVTIPDPGVPDPPTAVLNAAAGNLTGTFEYVITFVTAGGESLPGGFSAPVVAVAQKANLSVIPVGGTGTTRRRIYRSKNGGAYAFVAEIADVVTTTYTDNIADGALGAAPPTESTAERVTVAAESDDVGLKYNLLANTITKLTSAPDGVTDVVNVAPFTGGSDEELTESFRERLLKAIRNPGTGSLSDLESWAEEIPGVGKATAFDNETVDANLLSLNEASLETSAADWTALANVTVVQSATVAADGTKSLRMTATAGADMSAVSNASHAATPGLKYTALAQFRTGVTGRQVKVGIQWRDAGDVLLSTVFGSSVLDTAAGFTQASVSSVAPANATKMRVVLFVVAAGAGEQHYVDKILLAKGTITAWTAGATILTPAPGHVTIRISASDGSVPSQAVIDAVQAALEGKDIANISIHTTSFTPDPIDVAATMTLSTGYVLADVHDNVVAAITAYINSLDVGETFRLSGVISAVTGIIGVADVVITNPIANSATAANAKKTPGTITVT